MKPVRGKKQENKIRKSECIPKNAIRGGDERDVALSDWETLWDGKRQVGLVVYMHNCITVHGMAFVR